MTFMSKLIYLNSLKLGVVVILGSFAGNALAISPIKIALIPDTPSKRLVADLPSALPPANLPVNPSATVKVPPLNRPKPEVVPTTPNARSIIPKNPAPAVPSVPTSKQAETNLGVNVPQIIEFGQPLPKLK